MIFILNRKLKLNEITSKKRQADLIISLKDFRKIILLLFPLLFCLPQACFCICLAKIFEVES